MNRTDHSPTTAQPGRQASRRATALTLLAATAVVAIGVIAASDGRSVSAGPAPMSSADDGPREDGVGACLRLAAPLPSDGVDVAAALTAEARRRPHLFPVTSVLTQPVGGATADAVVALLSHGVPSDSTLAAAFADGDCADPGDTWSFTVTRDLLADGADRLVEGVALPPDWRATVDVAIYPADQRVRSTLHFSGPMGIDGTCWVDETLGVADGAAVVVDTVSGNDAGLLGAVACSRFEAELSEGGAGAQALALFPDALTGEVPLRALSITLSASRIVIGGDEA